MARVAVNECVLIAFIRDVEVRELGNQFLEALELILALWHAEVIPASEVKESHLGLIDNLEALRVEFLDFEIVGVEHSDLLSLVLERNTDADSVITLLNHCTRLKRPVNAMLIVCKAAD